MGQIGAVFAYLVLSLGIYAWRWYGVYHALICMADMCVLCVRMVTFCAP